MADQPKTRARRAAATPVTRAPEGENLESLLTKLADKVQTVIRDLVNDVTTLEVRTFVCNQEDLTKAGYDVGKHTFVSSDGTPVEIELRALTAIELDGDINSCMPYVGGKLDTELVDRPSEYGGAGAEEPRRIRGGLGRAGPRLDREIGQRLLGAGALPR